MKVYVAKTFTFEAAHNLPGYDGACANLHGHSYKLEVKMYKMFPPAHFAFISGENPGVSMVADFKHLSELVKKSILSRYDHSNLNEYFTMPTAENMVISFYYTLASEIHGDERFSDVHLASVKLWETENSYAEFRGE